MDNQEKNLPAVIAVSSVVSTIVILLAMIIYSRKQEIAGKAEEQRRVETVIKIAQAFIPAQKPSQISKFNFKKLPNGILSTDIYVPIDAMFKLEPGLTAIKMSEINTEGRGMPCELRADSTLEHAEFYLNIYYNKDSKIKNGTTQQKKDLFANKNKYFISFSEEILKEFNWYSEYE